MERSTVANQFNLSLIEDYYQRWINDPDLVDGSWRNFFQGYELGRDPRAASDRGVDPELARGQAAVTRLIDAYREFGHYVANLDPLRLEPGGSPPEHLEPAAFGLTESDLDRVFYHQLSPDGSSTLRELIEILRETYCRTVGVEFMHIRDAAIRQWLLERMEPVRNRPRCDIKKKRRIVYKLNVAELFETFLHKNYVGQKRFSLEGGEMLIPSLTRSSSGPAGRGCWKSSWACRTGAD